MQWCIFKLILFTCSKNYALIHWEKKKSPWDLVHPARQHSKVRVFIATFAVHFCVTLKFSCPLSQGKQKQICACVLEISCWLWAFRTHLPQLSTCWPYSLRHRPAVQQNCCLDESIEEHFFFLFPVSFCAEKSFLHFLLLLPVLANEAYTWEELAAAIRKAYREITEVYVLPKLINFTESIHPYLNDASKTPGRH